MSKLLTAAEVAILLNVKPSWVETQGRPGKIPKVIGLGKYVRFHPDVIDKLFFTGSLTNEYKRKQSAS